MSEPAPYSEWKTVGDIPGFPFKTFQDLQSAVACRKFGIGVDPLAAAEWSDRFSTGTGRVVVGTLSVLLIIAALAASITAIVIHDYWLLAALPVMGITFYFSHPASSISKWVTVGGALSVAVFVDLLLNGLLTAATLAAYAGLTFAAVRAAGFVTTSGYRKALLKDEAAFVAAYARRACNIRDTKSERIYIARFSL